MNPRGITAADVARAEIGRIRMRAAEAPLKSWSRMHLLKRLREARADALALAQEVERRIAEEPAP